MWNFENADFIEVDFHKRWFHWGRLSETVISPRWVFENCDFTEVEFRKRRFHWGGLSKTPLSLRWTRDFRPDFRRCFLKYLPIHPIYCPLLVHRRTFYASVLARRTSKRTRFSKDEKRDEKKRTFRTKTEKSDQVRGRSANLSAMAYTRNAKCRPGWVLCTDSDRRLTNLCTIHTGYSRNSIIETMRRILVKMQSTTRKPGFFIDFL